MNKMLALGSALVCVATGVAATFPDGGTDISSTGADGWNGNVPTSEEAAFPRSGSYTCSGDVAFWSWKIGGRDTVQTFDLGTSTVSLTRGNNWDFQTVAPQSTVVIRGGKVDFSGRGRFSLAAGTYQRDCRLVFDGTEIAHGSVLSPVSGTDGHDSSVVFTNAATASFYQVVAGGFGGYRNTIELNAGCKVTTTSSAQTDDAAHAADASLCGNTLRVRGLGAVLKVGANFDQSLIAGHSQSSNRIEVLNGGEISCKQFFVGNGNAVAGNVIAVADGGVLSASDNSVIGQDKAVDSVVCVSNGTLKCGWELKIGAGAARGAKLIVSGRNAAATISKFRPGGSASAQGVEVEVADGASMTCGTLQLGNGGGMVNMSVVNAKVRVTDQFTIGESPDAANCSLSVEGPGTNLWYESSKLKDGDVFGEGGRGVFALTQGATNAPSTANTAYLGRHSDENQVRIDDAAAWLQATTTLNLGTTAADGFTATASNVISIAQGGLLQVYKLQIDGVGNGLEISNGSCRVTRTFDADDLLLGCGGVADRSASDGNYLRLSGEMPKIHLADAVGVKGRNGTRIIFDLPATPYAEAPVKGNKLDLDATCSLEIDTCAAGAGCSHGRLDYPLVSIPKNSDKGLLSDAVIDAANAKLSASRASLRWRDAPDGRHELFCRIPGNQGLLMIVR